MNCYQYTNVGLLDKIVTTVKVDVTDYETTNNSDGIHDNAQALWDTGSTVTVISSLMVEELGLMPTDITSVRGFEGNIIKANTYNIDLWLNDIHFEYIQAIEANLTNIDMILGMDVLCQGALSITHQNYTTKLIFEKE